MHRRFNLEVRAHKTDAGEATRSFDVVASTTDEDSYSEVVIQNWDLSRYLGNPVVLWNHQSNGGFLGLTEPEDSLPIGWASNVRVEKGKLLATLNFVDARANPLAEQVYQGMLQGSIRTVSVGFMPGKARMVPRSEMGLDTWKDEDGNEAEILTLDENELYEISPTAIPANAACIVQNSARFDSIRTALKLKSAGSRNHREMGRAQIADIIAKSHATASVGGDILSRAAARLGIPETAVRAMAEQVLGSNNVTPVASSAAPIEASAPAPVLTETHDMDLELLAKSLGCDATIEAVIKAIESLRTAAAAKPEPIAPIVAELVAGIVDTRLAVVLSSLSLEESATEGQVAKTINDLTSKASRVDELTAKVSDLSTTVQKHADWLVERDVAWVVDCGERALYGIGKGQNQKALIAYRKSDPVGFSADFVVALDGLKAFDRIDDFKALTAEGGKLAIDVPASSSTVTNDAESFDARVKNYVATVKAKEGRTVSETEAIWAVGKGLPV